jgi:hypothetical protein
MSNVSTISPPLGQVGKLVVLLDALDGVALSDSERVFLAWLADSRITPWTLLR